MTKQPPAGKAAISAGGEIHGDRLVDKNALFAPLFRHQRQPARYRIGRIGGPPRTPRKLALAQRAFARAKERLAQLRFPGPRQPGNAQDLPFTQAQRNVLKQRVVMQPVHRQQ